MPNWDERYASSGGELQEPAPLLVNAIGGRSPGRALDLACGLGRHAIFLARLGWQVTAVDSSTVAIEQVRGHGLVIDARLADLDKGEFSIDPNTYDLVCDIFYLQRSLFPQIRAGIRPGGLFVGAIHMVDPDPQVKPMNPAYLVNPGELQREFAGWEILHYAEVKQDAHRRRVAELVARRP